MTGRTGDELLAYETLAAAAADPSVPGFDFGDLKEIEEVAEGRPKGWVNAAAAFFAYRAERGSGVDGEVARRRFGEAIAKIAAR